MVIKELPNKDSQTGRHSDPYVRVSAYRSSGRSKSRRTKQLTDNGSPEWNQWLDFGGTAGQGSLFRSTMTMVQVISRC